MRILAQMHKQVTVLAAAALALAGAAALGAGTPAGAAAHGAPPRTGRPRGWTGARWTA